MAFANAVAGIVLCNQLFEKHSDDFASVLSLSKTRHCCGHCWISIYADTGMKINNCYLPSVNNCMRYLNDMKYVVRIYICVNVYFESITLNFAQTLQFRSFRCNRSDLCFDVFRKSVISTVYRRCEN